MAWKSIKSHDTRTIGQIVTDIFVTVLKECKIVFTETRLLLAERIKQRIASHNFSSRVYRRQCKEVLNNRESSVSLLNQFETLTSTADYFECFACKFSSKSTFNSYGVH